MYTIAQVHIVKHCQILNYTNKQEQKNKLKFKLHNLHPHEFTKTLITQVYTEMFNKKPKKGEKCDHFPSWPLPLIVTQNSTKMCGPFLVSKTIEKH